MIIFIAVALAVLLFAYLAVKLLQLKPQKLVLVIIGFVTGSLVGALFSVPLSRLPDPYGNVLPITVTALSALTFVFVFYSQHNNLSQLLPKFGKKQSPTEGDQTKAKSQILVDTSAIIDGRIADITKTGFVPGKLLVPRFVLAELQNIADSEDSMRRSRGRRGLEMLNMMRQNPSVELDIVEEDPKDVKEVDHKLVHLARRYGTDILTTDYNLNRVATIESVKVLNINELANSIRPVVLPGEEMLVKVVQPGKEKNQGVGYLPDGTMIVVENGDKLIGKEVKTEVTRIFQTVAGKMIFATPMSAKSQVKNGQSGQAPKPPKASSKNRPTNSHK